MSGEKVYIGGCRSGKTVANVAEKVMATVDNSIYGHQRASILDFERKGISNILREMERSAEQAWEHERHCGQYERKHLLGLAHDPKDCPFCP